MAVSGSQKTRLGAYLSGVGKKLTITAKTPDGITETVLDFGRGLMRAMSRGIER
tara:strand:- start:655 stop:816 length:162 start_codon:yes stop_codon:yes gene_type:complete